jgi:hypothetical protein
MAKNPLKPLSPQLSTLAAQVVFQKHQRAAMAETAELREVLAEMMRRGRKSQELCEVLRAADPDRLTLPRTGD